MQEAAKVNGERRDGAGARRARGYPGYRSSGFLNVRVLDPTTAYQRTGQGMVRPTAHLADTLLVRGSSEAVTTALHEVTAAAGFELVWDERGEREREHLENAPVSEEQ